MSSTDDQRIKDLEAQLEAAREEHNRLAEAVVRLLGVLAPDAYGDMPTILNEIADTSDAP